MRGEDQALHADPHAGGVIPKELRKHGAEGICADQATRQPGAVANAVAAGAAGKDDELTDKVQRRGAEEEEPRGLEEEYPRQAASEHACEDTEEGRLAGLVGVGEEGI